MRQLTTNSEADTSSTSGIHDLHDLGPSTTTFSYHTNPATLHSFQVRALNSIGWGEWSEAPFLWTDPTVPSQDNPVECASEEQAASDSRLFFMLPVTSQTNNGYLVEKRELLIYRFDSKNQPFEEGEYL